MSRKLIFIAWLALALPPLIAVAQDVSARTVQYHSQDIVPIHAKLKYTTLIVVPPTEKIMEAATGDKDFWIVDVVGNFCFVHPAKAGMQRTFPSSPELDDKADGVRLVSHYCDDNNPTRSSRQVLTGTTIHISRSGHVVCEVNHHRT